jgi:DnaK suppressor protein
MTDVTARNAGLKQMLNERRRGIQDDVRHRMRLGRADRSNDVGDNLEHSDDDIQEGIEFALLQMRAETLTHIDEALIRLEADRYGVCRDCECQIAERRLRALPFAVRCQSCEQRRERAPGGAQRYVPEPNSALNAEVVSPQ